MVLKLDCSCYVHAAKAIPGWEEARKVLDLMLNVIVLPSSTHTKQQS